MTAGKYLQLCYLASERGEDLGGLPVGIDHLLLGLGSDTADFA